jgi:TRAP-type mannitol/chloroaromatic compound transport system substrate-binding protein
MSWSEGTPMLSHATVRFARNVEKMSGGRMRIIAISAKEVSFQMLSESFFRNAMVWAQMKNQRNINIRTFLSDVLDAFKKANSELLVQVAARSPLVKKVIDSKEKFLGMVKEWSAITDMDYLQLH